MSHSSDIQNAKNPDLRASLTALRRATQLARETAIQTDTSIIVMREGKMVRITAEELRKAARLESEHD